MGSAGSFSNNSAVLTSKTSATLSNVSRVGFPFSILDRFP
nr:MAG TPA: hypothetical protein [Bacteriophage sp.]